MHWTFEDFDNASARDINEALEIWELEAKEQKARQYAKR